MAIIDEHRAQGNELFQLLIIAPIRPGKSEAWRRFMQELHGSQRREHGAACRRMGIVRESILLATTRSGDWGLVALGMAQSAQSAERAMPSAPVQMYTPDGPFGRWIG